MDILSSLEYVWSHVYLRFLTLASLRKLPAEAGCKAVAIAVVTSFERHTSQELEDGVARPVPAGAERMRIS